MAERTYHLYANVSYCPPQCQYQNNMASLKRNALVVGYIRVKLTDISLQMIGYSFITKLHPLGSPDTLIWVLDCNLPFATALPIDDNLYPWLPESFYQWAKKRVISFIWIFICRPCSAFRSFFEYPPPISAQLHLNTHPSNSEKCHRYICIQRLFTYMRRSKNLLAKWFRFNINVQTSQWN